MNKAVWCITIIFISASINLHLIKIFPEILAKHNNVNVDATTVAGTKNATIAATIPIDDDIDADADADDDNIDDSYCDASDINKFKTGYFVKNKRDILTFRLACKDFYDRLNDEQKNRFRDVFMNCKSNDFKFMLNSL